MENNEIGNNEKLSDENNHCDDSYNYSKTFIRDKHILFLRKNLYNMPHHTLDYHKMTFLYFIVGGLIILKDFSEKDRDLVLNFVLNNACVNGENFVYGFRGGNFTGFSFNPNYSSNKEDIPHLASTYCALAILKMLGYETFEKMKNLFTSKFNNRFQFSKEAFMTEILNCSQIDGKIRAQNFDTENDVRFFYCAMCIFKLLEIPCEKINLKLCAEYLNSIRNYEGGFSMESLGESNAGLTFCAVASYKLLNLNIPEEEKLIHWLSMRSNSLGVNGRTNKIPDSCYSFWVLGSLNNLNILELFDRDNTVEFLLNCQCEIGGFSKHLNFNDNEIPDVLHTYYSLVTLSLLNFTFKFQKHIKKEKLPYEEEYILNNNQNYIANSNEEYLNKFDSLLAIAFG
jgi:geranylgeranyl transferase type-1 subunit beta